MRTCRAQSDRVASWTGNDNLSADATTSVRRSSTPSAPPTGRPTREWPCWGLVALAVGLWPFLGAYGPFWELVALAGGLWPLLGASGPFWGLVALAGGLVLSGAVTYSIKSLCYLVFNCWCCSVKWW